MTDTNGGVRAMWYDGGPLVVLSGIGDATASEVEEAIKDAVNEVVARAEGTDVPVTGEPATDVSGAPPVAPPAAPAAPVVRR